MSEPLPESNAEPNPDSSNNIPAHLWGPLHSAQGHVEDLKRKAKVPLQIATFCGFGLLLLTLALALFVWINLVAQQSIRAGVVPEQGNPGWSAGSPPSEQATSGPAFNLNEPHQKAADPWWRAPSPVQLSDSRNFAGQDRERNLSSDLNSLVRSNSALPKLEIEQSRGVTTVGCKDQILLTVLADDLPEYAEKLTPLARQAIEYQRASEWRRKLQGDLERRYRQRSPNYLNSIIVVCLLIIGSGLCFHRASNTFGHHFLDSPFWSMKSLIWCIVAAAMSAIVPGGQAFSYALGNSVIAPLFQFILVSIFLSLTSHIGNYFLSSYFDALRDTHRFIVRERMEQRLKTLKQASRFALNLLLGLIGTCGYAALLGFDPRSLAAGAGVLGVAVTWIGQDTFRDFLGGLNILLEDQFGVGDQIESLGVAGKIEGKVEAFTLRSTKVRSDDGSLCTIPNSEMRRVKNLSTGWSQVDFRITVSNDCEPDLCLKILHEECQRLAEANALVHEIPQLLGIEEMTKDGTVLRAQIRTGPGDQFRIKRELNLRLKKRFEAEGIELPGAHATHQVVVGTGTEASVTTSTSSKVPKLPDPPSA
jgi:moderate conductance mechanosensitive channel